MTARRYLSLMFVDLVGYTALSEQCIPEALGEFVAGYQALISEIITGHGGYLVSCWADGALAYFGFPSAHENDAERAVLAALACVQRIRGLDLPWPLEAQPLAARAAIHTGLVVIGPKSMPGDAQGNDVFGAAANIASRLQALAPPDGVLVSGETMSLVKGLFEAEPLGYRTVRGVKRPVAVYRIAGPRTDASRAQGRLLRGAVQFVGRATELDRLETLWHQAAARGCIVVRILGDPGIGKTRLANELCERLALRPPHLLLASCIELFASTPLYPAAQIVRARVGVGAAHSPDDVRRLLRLFLRDRGLADADYAAAAGLLGLGTAAADEGQQARTRQFNLVASLLERVARAGPSVLWIEDVHWIDPSSAELLRELVGRFRADPTPEPPQLGTDAADARRDFSPQLLVLMTQRRGHAVEGLPTIDETVCLDALSPGNASALARSVPGADSLPDDQLTRAVEAADGVPLFLEQLILFMLNEHFSGPRLSDAPQIPVSLSEMLSNRLDRIPGARSFALVAACVGRSFELGLVAHVLAIPVEDAALIAQSLVGSLVLQRGPEGSGQYLFQHALLHRAAYEANLRREQQRTHLAIHAALADPTSGWTAPLEVLAYHLTQAGEPARACAAWIEAGAHASRASANVEALDHLKRAEELLGTMRGSAGVALLEMKMLATRVAPLVALCGSASAQLETCCRRGLQLALDAALFDAAFPFLYGLCTVLMARANTHEGLSLARSFIQLAERGDHVVGRIIAHRMTAMALLMAGDLPSASQELERSLALNEAAGRPSGTGLYGHDARVSGGALLALVRFCLGDVERGSRLAVEALENADALRHPHSSAIAIAHAGWVLALAGAADLLNAEARRLIRVSQDHRLGAFEEVGWALLGWALCLDGELDQGIVVLQRALANLDRTDFGIAVPGYRATLADAQRRRGRLVEARQLTRQTLATLSSSNPWLEPEVRRVAALLEPPDRAAALLREAAAIARAQSNLLFEHRCLQDLIAVDPAARDGLAERLPAVPTDLAERLRRHHRFRRILGIAQA